MHPDQVHQILAYKNAIASSWAIDYKNLKPEYLKLLEDITPTNPLFSNKVTFSIFSEMVSVAIRLSERKNDKLYHSLSKDCRNALMALVISQYMELGKTNSMNFRLETISFIPTTEEDIRKRSIEGFYITYEERQWQGCRKK